jgi:hypothetical protein
LYVKCNCKKKSLAVIEKIGSLHLIILNPPFYALYHALGFKTNFFSQFTRNFLLFLYSIYTFMGTHMKLTLFSKKAMLLRVMRISILLTGLLIAGGISAQAQITLTATAGTPTGSFSTVSDAFTAINVGTHQGTIAISVNNNTTEPASPVALNASGQGTASYSAITIRPTATVTISGAATSARGVIELNGADNVTINGDISGGSVGRDLTIQVTSTNTSTAAVRLIGNTTGGLGSTNITISNNIILGGSNTVSSTFGIYLGGATMSTSGTGPENDNVTIENNSIQRAYYGIYARGVATTGMLDNLNITLNSIGSDASSNYVAFRGIDIQQANAPAVTRNTVFNMKTAPGSSIAAIDLGANTNNGNISRNLVYGINNPNSGGWGAWGISISTTTGVTGHTIANNVIYDLSIMNYSATSTTFNAFGIRLAGGTNLKLYYNTVNLFGTQGSPGTSGSLSAALMITTSSVTGADIRNNIFANSLVGLSGSKSYAIYAPTGTTFSNINYNDYYASGTYGVLGYLGTDKTDITAWRAATSQDVNSISSDPQFNSNTLLAPSLGSPVLSAGTPITGITIDYPGNTRSTTAPSIGAYENAGDFAGPSITYTALANTTSTSNRTATATITDVSGVNTAAGTRPRLYYKRTADANAFNDNTSATGGWKYVEASNTSSPFSFTIDYSKLSGGISTGTTIQYFVVAQDLATTPNVSVNKATFSSSPTSVALNSSAFPVSGTINTYNIALSLSGNINVGTGNTYTTLTGTNGLFQALNNNVVTGNITVNITSDLTETGANALGQWSEEGTGTYTLTIRPSGAARTISGSVTTTVSGQVTGLVFINGADRVTIDGRVDGTGTSNGLTLSNTAATGSAAVLLINGPAAAAGSANFTVRNCNIIGGTPSAVTTNWGILAVGIDNDNMTIQQNAISKCFIGIDINGSASGVNDNLLIAENTIGADQAIEYIGGVGINISQSVGAIVRRNLIKNVISGSNVYGDGQIGVNVIASSSPTIEKNQITGIQYTGTAGYGGKGIYITTVTDGMISNNFISGISGDGWSISTANDEVAGIKILSGSNIGIQYNTVIISGTVNTTSTTVRASAALLINTGATSGLQVRNNILMNSFVSSVSGSKAYALYAQPAATAFTTINANDYYAGGTQAVLAYFGADRTTLSALQTATTQDANSITKEVTGFTNLATGDLHLTAIDTELVGVNIPGVTTDFDGETRRTPYMGADEVIPVITITQQPDRTATTCAGSNFSISTQATVTFGATISYQWIYRPSASAAWTNVVNDGVVSGATTATLTFTGIETSDSGQYTAIIAANGKADTVYSNTQDVTVYTPVTIISQPQSTIACAGNTIVLSTTATGSITGYQWQKDGTDITGATSAQYTITNAQASNQGTYRLRITGSCANDVVLTNPVTVTVANAAQITQNPPSQVFGCTGDNITLSVTATGGVGGYQWQKNGTDIVGATSAQYVIGNVNAASAGSYQVKVSPVCAGGQTVTSTATQVTFRPPVSITSQPQSLTLCTGVTANFSFTATGSIVSYQWQKNGVNIADATSAQFSIDSVTTAENGMYRGFTVGMCGDTAFTNPVTLTVARPLAFSVQPVSQNVCLGENITLLAGVEGTVTSYRWQKDNVDIPGQTGPGLVLTNVGYATAGVYRLIASSPCEIVSSNNITIFVNSPTRIVRAPENIPAAIGGTARAIVEVEGVGSQFTYQWYRGTTLLVDNERISGSQSSQLVISNVQEGDIGGNYYVVVTGKCGTATSANFALFVPNVNITAQPSNASVCEGGNATFTVAAQPTQSGATLSYQWMRGNTALTNGGRFSGVNTPTLTINNVNSTDAGTDYRVRITTNQGGTVVPSDYVTLTVNTIPAISGIPATITICEGSELRITAGTNGQQGLMYSWFKNNDPVGNDSVLVIPAVQAGDAAVYRVLVQNACGADTSSVEVTVDTKPSITAQPQNVNIQQGSGFTLSVTATGTGTLQYQWMKGGAIIPGATSNTYEVTNADVATHAGLYMVKITNNCGDVTSAEARVDIVNGIETTFADGFSLEANQPNPFGDATTISFTLAVPSNVRLFVTDVFGREVAVLANGMMDAGTKSVTVNSREFDLSSGVYYYTLRTGSHIFTRQMVIVR